MKKTIKYLGVLLVIMVASCTKDFQKINTNPASFVAAEPEAVLPGVMFTTINTFENANVTTLWEFSHWVDPYAERYNANNDGAWTTFYVNVLGNTTQLKKLFLGNPAYTNRMAITDIWECYVYAYMVGTWGPVPYSKAGVTSSSDIEYDSENAIYTSLLTRLTADAAAIKVTGGDGFASDPIYPPSSNPGSLQMSRWIKFANSLRLRIALTVQNNLPTLAASNITTLMANEAGLISSDADDPTFTYNVSNVSPYNTQLVVNNSYASGAVMQDYLFTYFRSYHDPRIDAYFKKAPVPYNITDTLTSTGSSLHYIVSYPIPHLGTPKAQALLPTWSLISPADPLGYIPFNGSVYSSDKNNLTGNYSSMQPALEAAARPYYMMTFAEVCFMKSEAVLNIPGITSLQTADKYYYSGINANYAFWGLTSAQASAYEKQPGIAWSTAGVGFNYDLGFINTSIPVGNLTKIYLQQWINYYPDGGFETWLLQRRTQNLVLPPHTNPGNTNSLYSNLPDRFTYPVNEPALNPTGYKNALKLFGSPDPLGVVDAYDTHLAIEPSYPLINWNAAKPFYDISFVQKWYGTHIEDLQAAGIKYTVLATY